MTNLKNHNVIDWRQIFSLQSIIYTLLGVLLAVFAMKGFMLPNNFMDGGITGISILIHELFHINISLLVAIINIPFIYIGYKKIGKTFAIQATLAILLLSIGLVTIHVPTITTDKLLIAIFGGCLIGAGIGLVIRGGGVIDGAEIAAVFTTKKIGFTTSEIVLFFNALIFLVAALKLGIETAMYSMITYYTALKITDYIVDGLEEYTALTVISANSEDIKYLLVNTFEKGISVYKGERGYLPGTYNIKANCDIILTIVTRLEVLRLKNAILEIDPNAFMFVHSIKEARGGIIKKKSGH